MHIETIHPYDVLKHHFPEPSSSKDEKSIVIVGLPHLTQPLRGIKHVCEVLINYAPDLVLVESIPATAPYKESHYNDLFSQTMDSSSFYTDLIEAMVQESAITREHASRLVSTLQPDDNQARLRLAKAHFINRDDVNASYQWYLLDQENGADFAEDQPKLCKNIWNTEIGQIAFPVARNLGHERLSGMDCQSNYAKDLALLNKGIAGLHRHPVQIVARYLPLIPVAIRLIPAWMAGRLIIAMNTRRGILQWAKVSKSLYSSSDILEDWHSSYLDRNRCMVEHIVRHIRTYDSKRILVLVGAGHVAYFLWLLQDQLPDANLLTLHDLIQQRSF